MDIDKKVYELLAKKREIEKKAEATQLQIQMLQNQLNETNKDFLKVVGALEVLEAEQD